jgi:hypothetical protein
MTAAQNATDNAAGVEGNMSEYGERIVKPCGLTCQYIH